MTNNINFNLEEIKQKIPEHSSQKLCQIIIVNRYLNINNEITALCMQELAQRRTNGESFNYETYIEENLQKLPSLKFNSSKMDLRTIIAEAAKLKGEIGE